MDSNMEESEQVENEKNDEHPAEEENEDSVCIIPGFKTFDDYVKAGFEALKNGVKTSNSFPNGENFEYYSCFPSFKEARNVQIKKILDTVQGIFQLAGIVDNVLRRDVEEKFDLLAEANDLFLDRAGICMDEECGIKRNLSPTLIVSETKVPKNINGSWNTTTCSNASISKKTNNAQAVRLLAAKNIQRPQLIFKDKIDNSNKPWEPRIKYKPNMLKPLALYLEECEDGAIFNHPYEFELDKFQPPEKQLTKQKPIKYKPLDKTPLIIIEKEEDLKIMMQNLQNYDEIAVDLEHHSYRTFQGITCLMQISTRDTDYLIDTLTLRSELYELNEIFTKSTILKVFHGADLDIQWLQRDLSLYVVNMFDTHQAAKQLALPYLSLSHLLKSYCGIDPNKHFQLADWRIRPLPEELMKYAREDTHYLLYIKDILCNTLIDSANGQTNILKAVFDRSTEVCKQRYMKPIWREDSYMNMYRKSQKMFNNRQLYALKELYKWRDQTARDEDDSTNYVLPNHMLMNIAETLPREMQGILACCNPIPPLLRQNLLKLHKMILKAREQPLIKPVLEEEIRQRMTQRSHAVNQEIWNYSPHDMPSGMEARADLPCLLNLDGKSIGITKFENNRVKHTVTIFDSPAMSEDENSSTGNATSLNEKKKTIFVSPYERYKRVISMIVEYETREREKQEKDEAEKLKKLEQSQKETQESIKRVHEHFKRVSQNVEPSNIIECPLNEKVEVPLGQMPDRKRKRQMNESDEEEGEIVEEQSKYDFTTPTRSLKRKIDHSPSEHETKSVSPSLRPLRKGEKKALKKELKVKGMLPKEKFNYKQIDFSSFQGGSKLSNSTSATFQQKAPKNKSKKGKRKKRKINGI